MRNLVLILIAFIAVITFIRALDNPRAGDLENIPSNLIESHTNN
jgi:hypothetical protein